MGASGSRDNKNKFAEYTRWCRATTGKNHNPDISFFQWKREKGYIKDEDYLKIQLNLNG